MTETEDKFGVDETMDMLEFLQGIADRMLLAKQDDGKIDTGEIIAAMATESPAALSAWVGRDLIDDELMELTPEQRTKVLKGFSRLAQTIGQIFTKDPKKPSR